MKFIIILLLCCVCVNHGMENRKDVVFNISNINGEAYCKTIPTELFVKEGQTVRLSADVRLPKQDLIHGASCGYINSTGFHMLGDTYLEENPNGPWALVEENIRKEKFGEWRCELGFNKDNKFDVKPYDHPYTYINCTVRVKYQDDETPQPTKEPQKMDIETIGIIAGVSMLVLLIIAGQTIALCYFKRKAQPGRRMDKMTSRGRFDRGDQARYSAPPCRKNSKGNARAQAATDSHIYEMVGVNALYKESSELNQEVKTDTNVRTIRDRPPLPLPHEIPEPPQTLPRKPSPLTSTSSSLSLISSSSSTLPSKKKKGKEPPLPGPGFKKAPPRPPKQSDEDSLPGSLKRPPKTLPSPALVPKTGSVPRMPANDPAMMELKSMFKKRNVGNVSESPAPSPNPTLEGKPPKIQTKPNKKELRQEEQSVAIPPQKTPGGFNPLVPPGPSQIRLILPKIEACLKTQPNTIPTPQIPVKPILIPLKKPKSQSAPMSQPIPMSHPTPKLPLDRPLPPVSHLAPTQPAPVPHMSPLQSRPLPTPHKASIPRPHKAPTPRPLPPDPISQIYEMPEEDECSDDDEEWTYEQLDQFNIYNI